MKKREEMRKDRKEKRRKIKRKMIERKEVLCEKNIATNAALVTFVWE